MLKFDIINLHTVIKFQVFISNTIDLFMIIYFQVTITVNDNNHLFIDGHMVWNIPITQK